MKSLPTEAEKPPFQVPGYVHPGHDFRRDSAKLMQASLALAAPKIQSSNLQAGVTSMKAYHTSQLSTLSSQLSSCPQKAAELQFQVQSSRFKDQELPTDLHRFFNFQFSIAFGDDCHDSVNQASLLTLAAPIILNFQF